MTTHPAGLVVATPALNTWHNKKAAHQAPLSNRIRKLKLRRLRGLFLHRTGVETPRIHITIDEFDHRHRRVVAVAEAGLDDAGIAALAVLVAGGDDVKQLPGLIEIAHLGDRLPAHGEAA